VYIVTVTTLKPSGTPTDIAFSFQLTIDDPCLSVQLNIDPAVFDPNPIEYQVGEEAYSTLIKQEIVTSTETIITCPAIVFEITNRDATPLDTAIFSFADLQTFTIQTDDDSFTDATFELSLTAKYSGEQYTNVGTLDFEV
jgi:hypothetical protein